MITQGAFVLTMTVVIGGDMPAQATTRILLERASSFPKTEA